MMSGRLNHKIAVVTGGAMGIGRAITERFVKEGAKVVVADVNEKSGQAFTDKLDDAYFYQLDVSSESNWRELFAWVLDKFGKIDVLVNNAGIAIMSDIAHTSLDDWQKVINVNLTGVFLGTKHGILNMQAHGGSIINMSSLAGLVGDPNAAAYTASKGGVRLLTKSAATYGAQFNIRVNSVHPGVTETPILKGIPQAQKENIINQTPLRRMAHPQEIANMVLYLASDESSYSTGSEFIVDGGTTAN
ncbi:MAG: SDR family oxidoreductase [Lentilactobacillus buchneri]|jgi:NAD(P)-dependent dehydrogenase (short-subunit alcohol dehydrogenase family)|nr:SDR family oxidoreductase [Lentilactobacillus buchneri]MCI1950198.1 SDR family oxidoreductase [Lentilactobacillus buchneri]MCI2020493.1 SDR family oxidoreductase [Lentilactobacillus buchneri]MCI2027440.1 SDR family oxidoreductase [Lentilactobacillus buchneri]